MTKRIPLGRRLERKEKERERRAQYKATIEKNKRTTKWKWKTTRRATLSPFSLSLLSSVLIKTVKSKNRLFENVGPKSQKNHQQKKVKTKGTKNE